MIAALALYVTVGIFVALVSYGILDPHYYVNRRAEVERASFISAVLVVGWGPALAYYVCRWLWLAVRGARAWWRS